MRATVITDASFCAKTKKAGWAAWITLDDGQRVKRYAALKGHVERSDLAEMKAAANGIWLAMKYGATDVLLQSDCMAVIDGINQNKDGWKRQRAKAGICSVRIKAKHVKGHTETADARSYINRWCDQNAKNEMRKARK